MYYTTNYWPRILYDQSLYYVASHESITHHIRFTKLRFVALESQNMIKPDTIRTGGTRCRTSNQWSSEFLRSKTKPPLGYTRTQNLCIEPKTTLAIIEK